MQKIFLGEVLATERQSLIMQTYGSLNLGEKFEVIYHQDPVEFLADLKLEYVERGSVWRVWVEKVPAPKKRSVAGCCGGCSD